MQEIEDLRSSWGLYKSSKNCKLSVILDCKVTKFEWYTQLN